MAASPATNKMNGIKRPKNANIAVLDKSRVFHQGSGKNNPYIAAKDVAKTSLDTWRESLYQVLDLLYNATEPSALPNILFDNQAARQYNAALPDRDRTKLWPLTGKDGDLIGELRITIEELEKLDPAIKKHILERLGTPETMFHWAPPPQVPPPDTDEEDIANEGAGGQGMDGFTPDGDDGQLARTPTPDSLIRQLRVAVGLTANYAM